MVTNLKEQQAECPCHHTQIKIKGKPLIRLFCHCKICQEFNRADYADISIYLSKNVELINEHSVELKTYKSPPAVERGKCKTCRSPIIEFFDMPGLPSLTMIPSSNLPPGPYLSDASMHIFYHRRVHDVTDSLPKYSGFIRSQAAVFAKLLPELVKRKVFK